MKQAKSHTRHLLLAAASAAAIAACTSPIANAPRQSGQLAQAGEEVVVTGSKVATGRADKSAEARPTDVFAPPAPPPALPAPLADARRARLRLRWRGVGSGLSSAAARRGRPRKIRARRHQPREADGRGADLHLLDRCRHCRLRQRPPLSQQRRPAAERMRCGSRS